MQEKLKSRGAGKNGKKELDQQVLEELSRGDKDREEKIDLLYKKFDGTSSRLEKMKQKEEKEKLDRYTMQLDPRRAEEQKLFEQFEQELEKWAEYEEVGLTRNGRSAGKTRRRSRPTRIRKKRHFSRRRPRPPIMTTRATRKPFSKNSSKSPVTQACCTSKSETREISTGKSSPRKRRPSKSTWLPRKSVPPKLTPKVVLTKKCSASAKAPPW